MNVYNSSKSAVKEIDYFAGASSDKQGNDLFRSKKVSLQALDPETGRWVELSEDGRAVGYVGRSDEIPAGYEVDIPLRINVRPTAPVGAGFTLGAGLYVGDEDCVGVSDVAYRFKIVKSGGSGSTPQTGGSAPVPAAKPADNPAGKVSGSLAETGSSSALPVFATAGGAAVVLGAGAMFIVRRRRSGDAGCVTRPARREHGGAALGGGAAPFCCPDRLGLLWLLRRYGRQPEERQLQRAERLLRHGR